jgi:hypothetical protein
MRDAKYLVVIALLIIAVTVVPIIFAFEKIRQVDAILAEFAKALQAKEYERAYSLGTLEFKKAISLQEFEDGQRRLEARYGSLQSVSK